MAKIAAIVGPEFEDSELEQPVRELQQAGHQVTMVGVEAGQRIHGKRGGFDTEIEIAAADADPEAFDAMLIPGGHSPDNLRIEDSVVEFVRRFAQSGKPLAAVCHGPQLLIEADAVQGRTMTSWASVRKDLTNAGAHWVDEPVVVDRALITSRKPDDLPQFSKALLEQL